ncbi:hypothetical protein MITS9509_00999 [Synechococcus sp. MIT S9509]|uniref:DUF4236 domain-containing protein n=1 Tax=unclassified Synechococcus TaxID=2626047 RepID=UPI0007BB36E5|nr:MULTISPECIES: DUF4236 domain-containing protein [unclassified Synechococcus]KZR87148.1 hypothetical protein MITS9504_00564 [Synechococcus sp. MIT S9504]KZR92550.1 hypothetical protein MITS9509_00999 [Synechococcus sp. MIT S9509]
MGFRFRKRTRLFPGLNLNWSKNGLSSISIGGPGASWNIPIARDGQTRTMVGLPGTGFSYSQEGSGKRASVRERQQQQRPSPQSTSTEAIIQEVMATLCGPDHVGDALWRQGLVDHVLEFDNTPRPVREAALPIKPPESAELHMRRAHVAAATRRASLEIIHAVQTVLAWTEDQGWSAPND